MKIKFEKPKKNNRIIKGLFFISLLIVPAFSTMAQKFAYVDTQYILDNIPDYKKAQDDLDNVSIQWQKEIEAKYAEIDRLYKAYQAEQILLTEEMRKKREAEIVNKEKEAKDLQKQRFGVSGDLFKKRQELVKPIQDKVYNAVKDYAEKTSLMIIFDKAGDMTILYSNPKYDKSDEILSSMGYKPGTTKKSSGK